MKKIVDGIKLAPDATIIANGDASIFSSVDLPNKKIFYGFKLPDDKKMRMILKHQLILMAFFVQNVIIFYITMKEFTQILGDFFCPNCGYIVLI